MSLSLPDTPQTQQFVASLPLFDGFPYLNTRIVPAFYHITLLPQHWTADELTSVVRYQVAANRLPICLVLAKDRCVYYAADGDNSASDRPPRGGLLVADRLRLAVETPITPELSERSDRLHAVIARQSANGSYLLGDLSKGGRRATDAELLGFSGALMAGVPVGLTRCPTCGDWRGQCLDSNPDFENWLVPVACRCDNDNCCAWCGHLLYDRKLNGNFFDPADRGIWHVPGFIAFRHVCARRFSN